MCRKYTLHTLLFAVLFSFLVSCQGNYRRNEGMIWNTTWHSAWKGPEILGDSILTVFNEISKSLNVFDSTSVVSRVNKNEAFPVDGHFKNVYAVSEKVHKASGGMFDPTVSPLVNAWGFGPGHRLTADTAAVDSMLVFVGFGKTSLHGDLIVKGDRRTGFNFSAVAKGYACDAVADMFRRNGVGDFLIEIGGEIALEGNGPGGNGWRVSIDAPVENDTIEIHDSQFVVQLSEGGVATSGNYRNFRRIGGQNIGHTISPLTGRPVRVDILSATVIAPTAAEADAIATACMAAGSEASKEMIESLGVRAILVLSDSAVWKNF